MGPRTEIEIALGDEQLKPEWRKHSSIHKYQSVSRWPFVLSLPDSMAIAHHLDRLCTTVHCDSQMLYQLVLEILPGCLIICRLMSNAKCRMFSTGFNPYSILVVQSPSCLWLFVTPQTTARLTPLSLTLSRSLPKFMSIESVMPSNQLILCCPLLILPSIFPSIRVFSNESALCIRWLEY